MVKIDKFSHSDWAVNLFSESVTITGIGDAKFIYLSGIGAEDENGPRGTIRHVGDFTGQCRYAYDKIRRILAHHGADFSHVVKVTTYVTELRLRGGLRDAITETWGDIKFPASTMVGVTGLAFPEMMVEIDVTAVVSK